MKKLFPVILLCLIYHINLKAQDSTLEQKTKELMQKYKTIGLSAAVYKNNTLIYNQSFGLKNIEKQFVLNNSDIFRIASISKSFAATAIMQLVEKKKLSLEDDISNLIGFKLRNPNFPEEKITLKMLLSHTSSLNDKEGYFSLDIINPDKNNNWKNCFSNYKPGSNYAYCNLNYNLTGAIVERFSNERYDNYIKNHILLPLKIYGGLCVDSLDSNRFVSLYNYNSKNKSFEISKDAYNPRTEQFSNYQLGYSTPILSPTGGMKISAEGLAKYMMMHANFGKFDKKRIISKKSAKIMQTIITVKDKYGLALLHSNNLISDVDLTGHTGSAYGLFSAMFFDTKNKNGFVVITNGTDSPSGKTSVLLLEEYIRLLNKELIN